MANNRKSFSRRKNNKLVTTGREYRKQVVMSEPEYIFKERYITEHMLEKAIRKGMTKKEALKVYGKNRYTVNPNSKPIKVIYHKQ